MARRRSSSDDSGLGLFIGLALVVLVIYWAVCWPYLLGTWLAVQLGAEMTSSARTATGWALEAVYLAGLPLLIWLRRNGEADAHPALRGAANAVLGVFALVTLVAATVLLGAGGTGAV